MPENTSKRVATVYAEALYQAACGADLAGTIRADVDSLRQLLQQFPKFAQLLADPKIDPETREKMIRRTFESRLDRRTLNFLLVLNRRWRLRALPAILDEYVRMDNIRRLGRREVEVITAVVPDEPMLARIRQGIAAWGGFEPILQVKQDPSLLAGLVIRLGDQQIDASVKGQLDRLREQLKKRFATRVSEASLQA